MLPATEVVMNEPALTVFLPSESTPIPPETMGDHFYEDKVLILLIFIIWLKALSSQDYLAHITRRNSQ
jgi:hypothetical protein